MGWRGVRVKLYEIFRSSKYLGLLKPIRWIGCLGSEKAAGASIRPAETPNLRVGGDVACTLVFPVC